MPTAAEHISHMAYGATDRQSAEASTSNASRQARNDVAAEDVRWVTQDELTDLRAMQRTFVSLCSLFTTSVNPSTEP